MTYESVVNLIKSKSSMRLDTLNDLADLDLLIKEIDKCYTFDVAGIDTNYYRSGKSTLPGAVWFNGISHSKNVLFGHQGTKDGAIPDEYKKFYDCGVHPKAILDPDRFPQYWI